METKEVKMETKDVKMETKEVKMETKIEAKAEEPEVESWRQLRLVPATGKLTLKLSVI